MSYLNCSSRASLGCMLALQECVRLWVVLKTSYSEFFLIWIPAALQLISSYWHYTRKQRLIAFAEPKKRKCNISEKHVPRSPFFHLRVAPRGSTANICRPEKTKIHFSATEALLIFLCADKLDSVCIPGVNQMLIKPNESKPAALWALRGTERDASWMHMQVAHARHTPPCWSLRSCLLSGMCECVSICFTHKHCSSVNTAKGSRTRICALFPSVLLSQFL